MTRRGKIATTPRSALRMRRAALIGAVLGIFAQPAAAQDFDLVRTPGGARPFGEPVHWLNVGPENRLPIRERELVEQPSMTNLAPPDPRRSGWMPWIGTSLELNNTGPDGDAVLTVTPGLRYRAQSRRLRFSADYAFEAAEHLVQSSLSDAVRSHGGTLSLGFDLSPNTTVNLFESFSQTQDTLSAAVRGPVRNATRLTTNALTLSLSHRLSARTFFEVTLDHGLKYTDAPNASDIDEGSLAFVLSYALSETERLRAGFDAGYVNIGARRDVSTVAADVTYARDLGARLSFSGTLGVLHSSSKNGYTVPKLGASLVATDLNARYELSLDRDLVSVAGLGNLVQSDQLSGTGKWRLGKGLIWDARMEYQVLSLLNRQGTEINVTSAGTGMSYALNNDLWLWAQYEYSRERSAGSTRIDNRVFLGISRNLDF